jgi:hypothetical protein
MMQGFPATTGPLARCPRVARPVWLGVLAFSDRDGRLRIVEYRFQVASENHAMNLSFEVGDADKCRVDFRRDWFTGRATATVDGKTVTLASLTDLSTHISFSLTKRLQLLVRGHEVVIEITRALFFGAFRPQKYRVYVNGSLVEERSGY